MQRDVSALQLAHHSRHRQAALAIAIIDALDAFTAALHARESIVDEQRNHRQNDDGHEQLDEREPAQVPRSLASAGHFAPSPVRFGSSPPPGIAPPGIAPPGMMPGSPAPIPPSPVPPPDPATVGSS